MKYVSLLLILGLLGLLGCGDSPTEPTRRAFVTVGEPVIRPAVTRVPPTPTPCFATPFTDCGMPRPTPAVSPTPDAGNFPTPVPGHPWPTVTPTPEARS